MYILLKIVFIFLCSYIATILCLNFIKALLERFILKNKKSIINTKVISRKTIIDLSPELSTLKTRSNENLIFTEFSMEELSYIVSSYTRALTSTSILRAIPTTNLNTSNSSIKDIYTMVDGDLYKFYTKNALTKNKIRQPYLFYSKLLLSSILSTQLRLTQEGSILGTSVGTFETSLFISILYNNIHTNRQYGILDSAAMYRACTFLDLEGIRSYYIVSPIEYKDDTLALINELTRSLYKYDITPIFVPQLELATQNLYGIILEKGFNYSISNDTNSIKLSKISNKNETYIEYLAPFNYRISNLGKVVLCYLTDKQLFNQPSIPNYK